MHTLRPKTPVSCFKGTSHEPHPGGAQGQPQGQQQMGQGGMQTMQGVGSMPTLPQEAINACAGKTAASSCLFMTPNGTVSGQCRTPPNQQSLACVPQR